MIGSPRLVTITMECLIATGKWRAVGEWADAGWCTEGTMEGEIRTRYYDDTVEAQVGRVIDAAEALGIKGCDQGVLVCARGDGECKEFPFPPDWREQLSMASILHGLRPAYRLRAEEILHQVDRINRGIVECKPENDWGYSGSPWFKSEDGWRFQVFNDCDEFDYFEEVRAPSGRRWLYPRDCSQEDGAMVTVGRNAETDRLDESCDAIDKLFRRRWGIN